MPFSESRESLTEKALARNMSSFTQKAAEYSIGVAGCGGLGSAVAHMLARMGVGRLVLVDSDLIEISNLNRQMYVFSDIGELKAETLKRDIQRYNALVDIDTCCRRVHRKNITACFEGCSIVVEAFDTVAAKSMLIKAFSQNEYRDTIIITASGIAGIETANSIKTVQLARNIFVCGDLHSEAVDTQPLLASRVWLVAAHQAHMVARIIAGEVSP